jgi:hypothetical protein
MRSKDLMRVLQTMGLGVRVHDVDIDNGVSTTAIKTTEEEVAAIAIAITRVRMGNALDWGFSIRGRVDISSGAFGNQRFGSHC